MFSFPISHWSGIAFPNLYSLSFDGVNEYINIDNVLVPLANTTEGTIAFWVKVADTTPPAIERIIAFGDTNASTLIAISLSANGRLNFSVRIGGTTLFNFSPESTTLLTAGEWAHLVFVQDGVSPTFFVNAVEVVPFFLTNVDKTVWFNDAPLIDNGRIGCFNYNNGSNDQFFNGNIDEVAFWNSALTADEITELYNSGKPTDISIDSGDYASSDDLVAWHRMGDIGTYSTNWYLPEARSGLTHKKSVSLDGVDEYGNIDNILASLANTTEGTIAFWVKMVSFGTSKRFITFGDTDGDNYILLSINPAARLIFSVNLNGVVQFLLRPASTTLLTAGEWAHLVFVQDGVSPTIFVNAVEVTPIFVTDNDRTAWFNDIPLLDNGRIGCVNFNNGGNADFLNGNIDEVAFWNSALTADEVSALYNNGSPITPISDNGNYVSSANLVTWYRMGDDASDTNTTIIDQTGNGYNATLENVEEADLDFDAPLLGQSVNMEEADRESDVPS